jgi:hypothetical protein
VATTSHTAFNKCLKTGHSTPAAVIDSQVRESRLRG